MVEKYLGFYIHELDGSSQKEKMGFKKVYTAEI